MHDDETVSWYPFNSLPVRAPHFVHILSRHEGLTTFAVEDSENVCHRTDDQKTCTKSRQKYSIRRLGSSIVCSPGEADRVVAVAYPTAYDFINSRAYVLGQRRIVLYYYILMCEIFFNISFFTYISIR